MRIVALAAVALAAAVPAGAALAEEPARPPGPQLVLTGRATRQAPPDHASVSIGVTNRAATTAAAIDATSAAAAKILSAARALGIESRDLQTGSVSLQPAFRSVRDPGGGFEQRPDGYTAANTVTIRLRQLPRLGELLRAVVDGGANTIGGIAFELADPSRLEREALAAAVADARAQADVVADAAGVKLGRIESIRIGGPDPSGYGPRPGSPTRALASPAPAPPVPVEAGSLEVSAEVFVAFRIEQP